MKKILVLALAALLCLGVMVGCGGAAEEELVTLKVGASPTPHAEILAQLKEDLKAEGINLEIVEYTDFVMPNTAVENGELDANFFQHAPYMENFNVEQGTHLVSVAAIHYEPMGVYAGKSSDLNNIPEGAKIAVPNDTTNEARALLLLEELGIIKLKEDAGLTATKLDIVENAHNVEIIEAEAAQLPRSLPDVDFGVINGNYAIQAGMKASDALAAEAKDALAATTFANILTVKEGNENNEAVLALVKAMQSEKIKKYIEETYEGAALPVF
ncbi:MAG: ABC transporter substrate-binding protein [Clostridiales bacterium]|nr:ABC transporter substrate-binding protein [Clostridiales bacterium]